MTNTVKVITVRLNTTTFRHTIRLGLKRNYWWNKKFNCFSFFLVFLFLGCWLVMNNQPGYLAWHRDHGRSRRCARSSERGGSLNRDRTSNPPMGCQRWLEKRKKVRRKKGWRREGSKGSKGRKEGRKEWRKWRKEGKEEETIDVKDNKKSKVKEGRNEGRTAERRNYEEGKEVEKERRK